MEFFKIIQRKKIYKGSSYRLIIFRKSFLFTILSKNLNEKKYFLEKFVKSYDKRRTKGIFSSLLTCSLDIEVIWIWDLNLSNLPLCTSMSRHAPRLHNLDLFLGYDHESSSFQKGLLLGMVRLRKLEGFRLNETK